LCW
jgi:hypothetical protein